MTETTPGPGRRVASAEEIETYAERAHWKAEALLRAAAFDLRRRSVGVRVVVDACGGLKGFTVTHSTGCPDLDRIVELALRSMHVADAPAGMDGLVLDLDLGAARVSAA